MRVRPLRKGSRELFRCLEAQIRYRNWLDHGPIEAKHSDQVPVAQPLRALRDCIEDWLGICGRARDDAQDLGRGRLLLLGLNQFVISCLELLPRLRLALDRLRLIPKSLRKALLQVADPRPLVLRRPAGNRGLGLLGLRGLWTPAHRPPLASYESAGDTLGEPVYWGKGS